MNSALKKTKTLIVVDNFEEIEDENLRSFLHQLPDPSKALITSRERDGLARISIELNQMKPNDAINLLSTELNQLAPDIEIRNEQLQEICSRAGHFPIAIKWIASQMSITGQSVDTVLHRLAQRKGDVQAYCFNTTLPFISSSAMRILRIMSAFPVPTSKDILQQVSQVKNDFEKAVNELRNMYLIQVLPNGRYSTLPITRSYIEAYWREHPDVGERTMLNLTDCYVTYLNREIGAKHYGNIKLEYNNIRNAVGWCELHGKWEKVIDLADKICQFLKATHAYLELARFSQIGYTAAIEIRSQAFKHKFLQYEGSACKYKGEFARSIQCFNECLTYYRDIEDTNRYALMIMQLGILSEHRARYSGKITHKSAEWYSLLNDATQYLKQSLKIFQEHQNPERTAIVLHLLGRVHQIMGLINDGESYYRESLVLKEQRNDIEGVAITRYQIADMRREQKRFEEAEDLLKKSLSTLTELGSTKHIANAKWVFAHLKLGELDYNSALVFASDSSEGFRELGRVKQYHETEAFCKEMQEKIGLSSISGQISDRTQTKYDAFGTSESLSRHYFQQQVLIRNIIIELFNEDELRDLCFELDVDYDDLQGASKRAKARELVLYFRNRNKLDELIKIIRQERPTLEL